MFIAFEGPDNVGKSTTALALDCAAQPDYNITKEWHEQNVRDWQGDKLMPHTYDRIDWLSHMVYRLALPDREWNDARVRTVFAMPETHLVMMIHEDAYSDFTADEVVDTPIFPVNQAYLNVMGMIDSMMVTQKQPPFRSLTVLRVTSTPSRPYEWRLAHFRSATLGGDELSNLMLRRIILRPDDLLKHLQYVEQQEA